MKEYCEILKYDGSLSWGQISELDNIVIYKNEEVEDDFGYTVALSRDMFEFTNVIFSNAKIKNGSISTYVGLCIERFALSNLKEEHKVLLKLYNDDITKVIKALYFTEMEKKKIIL